MHQRRVKVRRLRIALGALTALTLVATGALGGVATALSWDGLFTPGPSWDDRYTITSYELTGTLHEDGRLEVSEGIEVRWHEPRRGLIRHLDRSAPGGAPEMTVEAITVGSRTQQDVWSEVRVDEIDGHHSVHLGEEHDFRPLGSDHYRISYELDGILVDLDGRPALRWNTFGDQWDTMIEQATVTLELPDGDHRLACVVGALGEAFSCDGDGPTWSAQELRPGRGMTVEAQLDPTTFDAAALPDAELGPLEEFSNIALRRIGLIVGLTTAPALLLAGTIGTPRTRRRREVARQRVETTGVAYAPPPGMRPLTAGMLVSGEASTAKDDQLFAAWLLDAQQRDLIEVASVDDGFRARSTGRGSPDSDAEAAAVRELVGDRGTWVTWDDETTEERGKAFEAAWEELKTHHVAQAGVPVHRASRVGAGGVLLLLLSLAITWSLRDTIPVAGFALVAGVLGAWGTSTYTDRTLRTAVADLPEDRLAAWRQVEGLRRFVAEAHAEQILGVAADPTIPIDSPFLELLPWVLALGCGDDWAERFERQIQTSATHAGVYAAVGASRVSQVRSAASPPSSSSSGSGGASGVGSGGGGGGGGSR